MSNQSPVPSNQSLVYCPALVTEDCRLKPEAF